jgi:4-amino-4-deoxy-L-arabinose transferase-like glycosyltransferase
MAAAPTRPSRRTVVWPLGVFASAVAVVLAYLAGGGLLTAAQVDRLVTLAADLAGAALIAVACGGLGRQLLQRAGWVLETAGERALAAFTAGWGVLAIVMLSLGVLGWISVTSGWVLVALALAVAAGREAVGWMRDVVAGLRALGSTDGLGRWATGLVIVGAGTSLLSAWAPPVGWDALMYHLALAKAYATQGSVVVSPDNPLVGMPQLGEMLYTLALLVRGEVSAQLLGWWVGVLAAVGLAGLSGRLWGHASGPWAAALIFSAPTVSLWLGWAYIDFVAFAMCAACLIALDQARRDHGSTTWRWWIAVGMWAGLALSAKYTAGIVPAGAVLAMWAGNRGQRRWRAAAVVALVAMAVFAPWLLKNLWLTGNPVYPLLFPSAGMDALRLDFYNRPDLNQHALGSALALFPNAVLAGRYGQPDTDATLGPLWLMLPLVPALAWRSLSAVERADVRLLGMFTLGAYAGWVGLAFFSDHGSLPRLFISGFAPLCVLGAGGLAVMGRLDHPAFRLSWLLGHVTRLLVAVAAVQIVLTFGARQPVGYLVGAVSAEAYRGELLGWYTPAIDRVAALPALTRTVFLWEPRSLACPDQTRCLGDAIIDRWYHLRRTLGSAEAVLTAWRTAGVTHVLVADSGAVFVRQQPDTYLTATDWAEFDRLRAGLVLIEDFGGAYQLYQIP